MRFLSWILILIVIRAEGQMPRNASGLYEYSYDVTVTPESKPFLKERARSFFNQPFLVHWDSVATGSHNGNTVITGRGYMNVRAKYHSFAVPRLVPVNMQLSIEPKDSGYRFIISRFAVNSKYHFSLEEKPEDVKSMLYDQLLQKTRKRVSFVIGWLKRYMEGQTFD
jgi:hypothetical protein